MKKRTAFLLIICVTLLIGWIWRYTSLNEYYKSISDQVKCIYSPYEKVYFEDDYIDKGMCAPGYWIRVDDFEVVDYFDYIERENIELPEGSEYSERIALVNVTLCNENSTAPGIMLTELTLHGIDAYSNINWDLLFASNEGLRNNPGISLSKGREYSLILPYNLKQDLFSYETWNNLDNYEFFLRITFFPTAKDIRVE